jgi:hypothetical protein
MCRLSTRRHYFHLAVIQTTPEAPGVGTIDEDSGSADIQQT